MNDTPETSSTTTAELEPDIELNGSASVQADMISKKADSDTTAGAASGTPPVVPGRIVPSSEEADSRSGDG